MWEIGKIEIGINGDKMILKMIEKELDLREDWRKK